MNDYNNRELLSVREVAEITGWSRSTVYNLCNSNSLPVVKLENTSIRINKKKLLELINGDLDG